MKKVKSIIFSIFLLILTFVSFSTDVEAKKKYEYEIKKYDVNIEVDKYNTLHITEHLNVYFNETKHGIYRRIPTRNTVKRKDGSQDVTHCLVKNIKCNYDYEATTNYDDISLKIGDEDVTYRKEAVDYTISYDYLMGNDVLEGEDEFYFNIIGTGWLDTTISGVTFAVTMPKEFDEKNVGMCYGRYGKEHTKNLYYGIDANTLFGELRGRALKPTESLTVRITLPEGYFSKTEHHPVLGIVGIILMVALLILSFIWWLKYGKDDPIVETVEFYPPEGMNSVDVAFNYRGELKSSDVPSLVVYLAQKGYIEICSEDKKKDFTLKKIKDYDGDSYEEKQFMKGLFSGRESVKKAQLQDSFYKTIEKIVNNKNTNENREKIFEASSLYRDIYIWIGLFIVIMFPILVPIWNVEYSFGDKLLMLGLLGLPIPILNLIGCYYANKIWKVIIMGICVPVGIYLGFEMMSAEAAALGDGYAYCYLICMILSIPIAFLCCIMKKRTPYGTEVLGKIQGFKNFLTVAKKEQLEALVEENPSYFYDILPYTYVLGVSDKWIKKFKDIAVESPEWYSGNDAIFDYYVFSTFMNRTMSETSSAMTSTPSSDGGGGFSGGGSGGGGGGSW